MIIGAPALPALGYPAKICLVSVASTWSCAHGLTGELGHFHTANATSNDTVPPTDMLDQ
ncbi:hypothetical protein PC116_g20262 [Phytophthora cactorum]|nr:hypothetical protein PC116_g20262 [Phytophthora cactorum]